MPRTPRPNNAAHGSAARTYRHGRVRQDLRHQTAQCQNISRQRPRQRRSRRYGFFDLGRYCRIGPEASTLRLFSSTPTSTRRAGATRRTRLPEPSRTRRSGVSGARGRGAPSGGPLRTFGTTDLLWGAKAGRRPRHLDTHRTTRQHRRSERLRRDCLTPRRRATMAAPRRLWADYLSDTSNRHGYGRAGSRRREPRPGGNRCRVVLASRSRRQSP